MQVPNAARPQVLPAFFLPPHWFAKPLGAHVATQNAARGAVRTARGEAVRAVGVSGLPVVRNAKLGHDVPVAQLQLAVLPLHLFSAARLAWD